MFSFSRFFLFSITLCLLEICSAKQCSAGENEGTLRVVGIGGVPYLHMFLSADGIRKGVDMDILRIIAEKLDMCLKFAPARAWGRNVNGNWTGTIGQVMRKEADVGVGHMSITFDRMRAVAFTEYVYPLDFVLYVARPKPLPPHFNLVKPFSLDLWFFFLFTPLFLSLFLIPFWSNESKGIAGFLENLLSIFMELLATLLGQSRPLTDLFKRQAFWFIVTWLLFTNLMLMAYECNLRAYLISVDYEEELNTVEDVYNNENSMYLPVGSFFFLALRTSNNEFYRRMHDKVLENEWYYKFAAGIPEWLEDAIAYDGATTIGLKLTWVSREKEMKEKFGSMLLRYGHYSILYYPSGFVLAKDFSLLPLVNDIIMHIRDNGIIAKLLEENSNKIDYDAFDIADDRDDKLVLGHLLAGILIYVVLMPLATIIFVLEVGCGRKVAWD